MDFDKQKEFCNQKYREAIVYAKRNDKINCRNALFVAMETLLYVAAKSDVNDRQLYEDRVRDLLKITKDIGVYGFTDDIMFRLTGEYVQREYQSSTINNEKENTFTDKIYDNDLNGGTNRDISIGVDDVVKNEGLNNEIAKVSEIPARNETQEISNMPLQNAVEKQNNNELRPMYLSEYVGQEKLKKSLSEAIVSAKAQNKVLDHILLFGSAGLGKTTLAKIIANEMDTNCIVMNGPSIKAVNDIVKNITNIKQGDILFIDEIHRISPAILELLYMAMEDFSFAYTKPNGQNVMLNLPRFTVIGATTHSGLLEKPMRDRFLLQFRLEPYSNETLKVLGNNSAHKLGYIIQEDAIEEIVKRSRGTPRICNNYIKRISDKAFVKGTKVLTKDIVIEFFDDNGIDELGLTEGEILYLETIIQKFEGGPVGLDTLVSATNEGKTIIENQYEPYLIYLGFIKIMPNGRVATQLAYEHLNKTNLQSELIKTEMPNEIDFQKEQKCDETQIQNTENQNCINSTELENENNSNNETNQSNSDNQ